MPDVPGVATAPTSKEDSLKMQGENAVATAKFCAHFWRIVVSEEP